MSKPHKDEELPSPAADSDEYLTPPSILDWIKKTDTSTSTSSSSQPSISSPSCQPSPILRAKRRRKGSLPSVFLGDKPSLRKRRRISQDMASNMSPPSTPSVHSHSTPSGGPYTPTPNAPSNLMESLKSSKNAEAVGQLMESNGLYKGDRAAFDTYPDFKGRIQDIVAAQRGSVMRPDSHQKFQDYIDWYEFANESTFLRKIFPLLMKDGYHLTKKNGFPDQVTNQSQTPAYLEYRDFMGELGIVDTSDREFFNTLVASTCNPESELAIAKLLAKVAGMKNPKPDYAFGLRYDKFPLITDVPVPEYIQVLLSIAPRLTHTFLIVEGKPDAGSQAEAENQARRGGATLVHAERLLRDTVGEATDAMGPDEKSFVFSVIFTPKMAEFWVHWYENKGPGQPGKYHMNSICSRFLQEEEMRTDVRRRMHNIMEWGGIQGTRFQELLKLHESIHTFARAEHTRKAEEARAAEDARKAGKGSPRKKIKLGSGNNAGSGSNQDGGVGGGSSRGRS